MRFKELVDNPHFISGIHNYCDRWCERCHFTARCAVYAAEEADPDNDYLDRDDPRDSDGSAKAALIAIDRSISAWKLICELQPENAESIHRLLFQLEKTRSGAEREFPNARDFIRPGFDEPTLDLLH